MTDNPASFGAREAQPIDAMMDKLMAQGWDFFGDKLTETLDTSSRRAWSSEFEAEAKRRAGDAAALFATREGREILEWLCDITVRRPIWVMNLGSEALTYAAMREGQNAIIYTLMKLIAEGRKEQPPEREGTPT